jgi:hypothetical protein
VRLFAGCGSGRRNMERRLRKRERGSRIHGDIVKRDTTSVEQSD